MQFRTYITINQRALEVRQGLKIFIQSALSWDWKFASETKSQTLLLNAIQANLTDVFSAKSITRRWWFSTLSF